MTILPAMQRGTFRHSHLYSRSPSAGIRILRAFSRATMVAVLSAQISCGAEQALDHGDHLGRYALVQVDGHDLGWYHQLNAVDCAAAFTTGELVMGPGEEFYLELAFNFRCFGAQPYDGSDEFRVVGYDIVSFPDRIVLNGNGPDLGVPGDFGWVLNVRPLAGDRIELRFAGFEGEYWGDPVLILGPKEPHD